MNRLSVYLFLIVATPLFGQSFAPAAGQPGSTAIHMDSNVFVAWASGIEVQRGFLDLSNPTLGTATFGLDQFALGQAWGDGITVVSLGDGGVATLTFPSLIFNGEGPDFAVFENGFADNYMEFAHVEVSSDGLNFFRFPSISETPLDVQLSNFSFGDCRYVHNLAGKYRQGYGTPFDLEDLSGISGLDINAISHVRLIDVVGSVDSQWGSTDSQGYLINDPFPTPFESGGFDLDAVGVIHLQTLGVNEIEMTFEVYPNPCAGAFWVRTSIPGELEICNVNGVLVVEEEISSELHIQLPSGIYFVRLTGKEGMLVKRLVVSGY
jgi:hypothetical protein